MPRFFTFFFFIVLALGSEALFLKLTHWQYTRYVSAVEENAAPRPQTLLTGHFIPSATTVLDNQPNPEDPSHIGWRLLVPFQTEEETLLIDRGWLPSPEDRSLFPPELLTLTSASPTTLAVTHQNFPKAKGWLKGPLTTTHPRILTRYTPAPVPHPLSPTRYAYEIPHLSPQNTRLLSVAPPARNPEMHRSYMLQWLGLALALPFLWLSLLPKRYKQNK